MVHTGYKSDPTIELTWALIFDSARHIVTESNSVRSGGWQQTVGTDLRGKTLGVLGLGRIGSQVARVGSALGMNLIAWSQNMTPEAAKAAGATLVSKDQLFERADILTIHLVLSSRTRPYLVMSFQGSSNRLAVTLRHMRQVMPCSVPPVEWAHTRSIWLSSRRRLQRNHPTSPLRRRHQCRWPPKLRGRESSPTVTWKRDKRSSYMVVPALWRLRGAIGIPCRCHRHCHGKRRR